MKLAYLDLSLGDAGPAAVLLHREGINSTADVVGFAQESGLFSRAAVPTGDYAYYPSGMSIGGTCWYRILPGFAGTDPISLTTAVVEVADLLGELALDQPVLVGWGQGAVVALGAGLWPGGTVGSVVCIDPSVHHLEQLPPAVLAAPGHPPVLLMATDAALSAELERQEKVLASRNIVVTSWCWSGDGADDGLGRAVADRIGRWVDHE
jgi:pimeloyl-ACP methyl ester carboxylesterase